MKRILLTLCLGLIAQSQLSLAGSFNGGSYAAPYSNKYVGRESLFVLSRTPRELVEVVGVKDGSHSFSSILLHVQHWGNNTTSHLGYYISTSRSDVETIVKGVCNGRSGRYGKALMGDATFARVSSNLGAEEIFLRRGEFLDSIYCD